MALFFVLAIKYEVAVTHHIKRGGRGNDDERLRWSVLSKFLRTKQGVSKQSCALCTRRLCDCGGPRKVEINITQRHPTD